MHYESHTDPSCSVLTPLQNLDLCIPTDRHVCEQTNMHNYICHMLSLYVCVQKYTNVDEDICTKRAVWCYPHVALL